MRSRTLVNILLLLAVAALALVARFEPGIDGSGEDAAITTLSADSLQRLHITRPPRDDLVLVRRAAQDWYLERAVPLPADPFKVNALRRLAEQPAARSYPAAELDLAELELDPPRATAVLDDTAVEFGRTDPIDGLRYVRVLDRVHLIPDTYLPLLEAGFSQFVRPRLFDAQARIVALNIPGLRIARDGAQWVTQPQQAVSADSLQQFLDTWQAASAISLLPADASRSGEPVTIELQGRSAPVQLQIVERRPQLVLVRPDWGIEYHMGDRADALLNLPTSGTD